MTTTLTEARPVLEATPDSRGRIEVTLISPGWGSSGHYSPEILEQAARDGIFPAGLHMYVDHPTQRDLHDRPERSVRDLAAVLVEAARWDGGRLVAEAQLLPPHAETFRQPEVAEAIGVSIRASAEDVTMGQADGRRGPIIGRLVEAQSVDFVTRAGRGGRYQVIESATPSHVVRRAVDNGVSEATANDLRDWLQSALRDAYGAEQSWVWVRDFDDTTVWFEHETPDGSGVFQHTYTASDSGVQLTGTPVEVRAVTQYVPVNPAGDAPTQESQEDTMPQIEEGRLAQLEEAAGRVSTLESERDAAKARADQAEAALAEATARHGARPTVAAKIAESKVLAGRARTQVRLVESVVAALPVVDGKVADDALTAAVEAAVTDAEAEFADVPAPAAPLFGSFGSVTESAGGGTAEISESDFAKAMGTPFGQTGA